MRKATKNDLPILLEFCLFPDAPHYSEHTRDRDYILNSLERCCENPAADLLVVERNEESIGTACAIEHQTLLCPDKEYSEMFVTCSDPRGTLRLIAELERLGRERGAIRMNIGSSTADNPRYCQLLERKGFSPFGRSFRKVL